jgi:hypothetical protein
MHVYTVSMHSQTLHEREFMHVYTVAMHSQTLHKRPFRSSCMCTWCRCTHKLIKCPKDVHVKFVSASTPCIHAWTPEKNRLILIILQCNTEHKNIFLHIPGLKITQIKIPWNVVDDVGTLNIFMFSIALKNYKD